MSNTRELYNQAVTHHKAGRFADAEKFYRQLISLNPTHSDAVRLLGGLYFQNGEMAKALEFLEKAVKVSPRNPEPLTNLGSTLRALGRMDEAIDTFRQALEYGPDYLPALINLGAVCSHIGRMDEALKYHEKVLKLSPENAEAHFYYGKLLEKLGQGPQALKCYEQAVKLKPDYIEAMTKLGVMLSLMGHGEQSMRRLDAAQNLLEKKYQADPHNVEIINNLGHLLLQRGNPIDAVKYYRQALSLRPKDFSCALNLASCLYDLNQLEEALPFSRLAVRLKPDSTDAHIMLGLIFHDLMRHEEAIEQYDKALELNPTSLSPQMKKSLSLLALGQYEEGFRLYESGLVDLPYMRGNLFTNRRWQGESLVGKRLLIWNEQGFGDNLQFIRYAQLCKERGGKIIVLCPTPLRSLFRNCSYIDELPESVTEKDFDCHVPIMSLPFVFHTTIENIPAAVPYLFASNNIRAKWAEQFIDDDICRVGLVWSGHPRGHELKRGPLHQRRNIDLEKLRPLFDIPGIQYYSLQMGAAATQIDTCNLRDSITDLTPHINDYEDTAAIVENLDLVISVDTSVVHLVGGMGKPVWVMSRFDACWRWLQNRPDNPWYPTAKVFGQKSSGDWEGVIDLIRNNLEIYSELIKSEKKNINNYNKREFSK